MEGAGFVADDLPGLDRQLPSPGTAGTPVHHRGFGRNELCVFCLYWVLAA